MHAVLGTSEKCIASYPGDFAVALVALDAEVEIVSARGHRIRKVEGLHRLPDGNPDPDIRRLTVEVRYKVRGFWETVAFISRVSRFS